MSGTVIRYYEATPKEGEVAVMASDEAIQEHLNSEVAQREPSPEAGMNMWTMHEELLQSEEEEDDWSMARGPSLRTSAHVIVCLTLSSLVLREMSRLFFRTKSVAHQDAVKEASYYF